MATKSFQEFIKNRNPDILDRAWHTAKLGDILPENDIYIYAQAIHRNDEDWGDGDIGDRIGRFFKYQLQEIPLSKISRGEFNTSRYYIKLYRSLGDNYPPIILGTLYSRGYAIIDGSHRVEALAKTHDTILAWVGQE